MDKIEQTAHDALQAKRSAWVYGGFRYDEKYGEILQQMMPYVRRQTPLVNAGYGLRVRAVLEGIRTFLDLIQADTRPCNLVLLGAGMDVTGVWALQNKNIHVWEVDTIHNCKIKHEKLSQIRQWDWNTSQKEEQSNHSISWSAVTECVASYELIGGDLRDEVLLELLTTRIDTSLPTMVLSELVLTYLGNRATQQIFRWCSNNICQGNSLSCLFFFENMGADHTCSVLESYKASYTAMFQSKLERGLSDAITENMFQPIAISPKDTERVLVESGFRYCSATTALAALKANHNSQSLVFQECFDEHSALLLHLQSYCVCLAFNQNSSSLVRAIMAPWSQHVPPEKKLAQMGERNFDYWITEVGIDHEGELRDLFESVYKPLYTDYPVIRKMVNGAVRKDFCKSDDGQSSSVIARWYREAGGYYLVALDCDLGNTKCSVLGGIGVRKMKDSGLGTPHFEIIRLFVRKNAQGFGVAATLLDSMIRALKQRFSLGQIYLEATTVDILSSARGFYQAKGFTLKREETLNGLGYLTYTKIES